MKLEGNWLVWSLLSAIFAALTAILAKVGMKGVDSDLATLVRTGMVLALLAVFVGALGKFSGPFDLSAKSWSFLALSAVATGASWVCYFRALQAAEASRVAAIDKLSVVLVALFAVVFLGERPAVRDWCGIALVAGGVVLLSLRKAG